MLKYLGAVSLLFVAALVVMNYPLKADDRAEASDSFSGKVILVGMESEASNTFQGPIALINGEIKKLGEDSFVVGDCIAGLSWAKKQRVWLPIDDVQYIAEYHSVDDLRAVIRID